MGLNGFSIIIHLSMANTIRIYFSDVSHIVGHSALHLIEKTSLTRLYSNEGIFNIKDNKITRVKTRDQSVETLTVNTIDFLVDKSSITYDTEWFQISPEHITETIYIYSYAVALPATANRIKLIMEKQAEQISAVYFELEASNEVSNEVSNEANLKNMLVTFLSTLNLC